MCVCVIIQVCGGELYMCAQRIQVGMSVAVCVDVYDMCKVYDMYYVYVHVL